MSSSRFRAPVWIVVAGVIASVVIGGTAQANPQGVIAFAGRQNSADDWDIWAINPDGTGLRQLVDMPGLQMELHWSPDSSKIVYSSDNDAQLWVYDWHSGTNTKIYDASDYGGAFAVEQPAWSPDGQRILFLEYPSYNNPQMRVINADGTGRAVVPVQSGYVSSPSWAPDGSAFVYGRRNSSASHSMDMWTYDFSATNNILAGTNRRLTQGAGSESSTKYDYDWAPNDKIVHSWGHNIAVLDPGQSPTWGDPATPQVTFLTSNANYPALMNEYPSWSPDFSQIAYVRQGGGASDLWMMNADGSNAHLVPNGLYLAVYADWGNPTEPIPEPASLGVLFGLGALGLVRYARRRKRAA